MFEITRTSRNKAEALSSVAKSIIGVGLFERSMHTHTENEMLLREWVGLGAHAYLAAIRLLA